jgi:outer membrane protein assembly factor BamB
MCRFATVLVILALGSSGSAVDQAMFRGDARHSGVYASAPPTLTTLKWTFTTQGKVLSTPAVADGVVYVGSADRFLYAIRASDGTEVWKFQTSLAVHSSPAVADGLVYVSSLDGNIYAVRAASGELAWKVATGGERRFTRPGIHGIKPATEMMPDPFDAFLSSPVVVGGRVYIGSGDTHVYALDAKTGAVIWKFATGDVVHATPAVVDGVVYIGSWDRNLYALNADTGKVIWRFETGDDPKTYNQMGIASSAAVVDGVVLFGGRDGRFHAVDARTGQRKWAEDNKGGWVIASPAVRDGVVYFPTSDGTQFKAITIATGALVWRTVNKAVSFSSPAIAGNLVYFGAHDGWLRALDLATGAVRAEFQTDGNKANAAKYVNPDGSLNYRAIYPPGQTLDDIIIGLDRMHSLGSVLSSPVIADGVAYFGSTDGKLYAVR